MAEDDKQPGGIGIMDAGDEASGQKEETPFLGQQQRGALPLIYIGRKFKDTGTVITSVASGGRGYASADETIAVVAGRQLVILGLNLDKFESVALRIGNTQYSPLNLNIFPTQISFNIKDYDNDLLSGGGVLRLEFLSLLDPAYNARLNNKLVYKTQKQIEESEKEPAGGTGGHRAITARSGRER
ncbi:MAG: hypothetical protein AAB410_05355, partial [Patescibacteria group bacterium]